MCSKMEDSGEKRVTSSNRRNNKPLMEKRRRQRINDCLVQLKGLVLQAMNKDSTQYSKLEKADILEMTVKHLKMVQRQQMTAAIATDPNAISKYRAGFNDCAAEIARYLDNVNGGSPQLKSRVMSYLGNSMLQFPVIPVYQGVVSPYPVQVTSPVTSQGCTSSAYAQMMSSGVLGSPYPSPYHIPSQINSCDNYKLSHQSKSTLKSESPDIEVTPPRHSHMTSPERRVPSPCGSDSGLSDISVSHDENGNYTNFTSPNQQAGFENDKVHAPQALSGLDVAKRSPSDLRCSPKRPRPTNDNYQPLKRAKTDDYTVKCEHGRGIRLDEPRQEHARDFRANEPMWRPW